MLDSKNLNSGLLNLRQVFFGKFDLTIHKSKERVNCPKPERSKPVPGTRSSTFVNSESSIKILGGHYGPVDKAT